MPGHQITTAPAGVRVRVEVDVPRSDVRAELLLSDTQTHCPFKGDASVDLYADGARAA